jgi:hypothetical protein
LFNVDFGSDSSLTIVITAKGSQPNATATTLTITAALRTQSAPPPPGTAQSPDNPSVTVQTTSVTRGGAAVTSPQLKIVSQTSNTATVALDANPPIQAAGTSQTATFNCAPGATVQVKAVVADTPGANGSFTAYYRFDHPSIRTESDPISYAVDPDHTRDQPAPDQTPTSTWPGNQVQDELLARLTDIAAATPITILGYASFEAHDNPAVGGTDWIYNNSLANNRAAGLAAIIAKDQSTTFTAVTAKADMSNWGPAQGRPGAESLVEGGGVVAGADASGHDHNRLGQPAVRPAAQPVPVPDNPQNATAPPPPSWFKKIDIKVRIVRDHFVAAEVAGKFDIQTASEEQLAQGGVTNQQMPGATSPPTTPPTGSSTSGSSPRSTTPPTSSRKASTSAPTRPTPTGSNMS